MVIFITVYASSHVGRHEACLLDNVLVHLRKQKPPLPVARLEYLQLRIPLTFDYPYSDVMPVTTANQVIARVEITGFTFCTMLAKSWSSPITEQWGTLSLDSRRRAIRPKPSDSFQDWISIYRTSNGLAFCARYSVRFGTTKNGEYCAVIGQSPSPAVSSRCCNSAPRQGAMKRP